MPLSKKTIEVCLDLLKSVIISPAEVDAREKFEMSHTAVTELNAELAEIKCTDSEGETK